MDTKQRILDAAESLFAEYGFDGASLRSITAVAGVNLAAVNYHFRSKEELVRAVLARKLAPINRRRLELLDACEAEAGARPVPLEKLVHAMIVPMLQFSHRPGTGMGFGAVMGRVYLERDARLQQLLVAELQGVIRRFLSALSRALPGLPAEELYWRMFLTMGTVSHTMAAPGMLALISGGACDPSDADATVERLMSYVIPALKAPLPPSLRRKGPRREATAQPQGIKEGGTAARR